MEPMLKAAAPQAAPADLIKDSDQTKFAKDVLEASRTVPVIVDFWAPWCGPCKTLQPTIEKVVKAANGAVKLVKINIDQNQMLAQQLRIQSIPAVYAFFGGRPVLDVILERMPATFLLMGSALSLAILIGATVGVLGAVRVGNNVSIAPGCVVRKDVPDDSVVEPHGPRVRVSPAAS